MTYIEHARQLLKEGKNEDAARALSKALVDEPDNIEALFLTGQILMTQNQQGLALALLQKVTFMSDEWKHWMVLGACEAALQRPVQARAAIKKAMAVNPGHPELLRLMSNVCVSEYLFDEACEWADKALEREEHPQGYVSKAFAQLHKGLWEEGWKNYHKGLGHMRWRDKHDYGLPDWEGQDGTLLVYAEQGLGDQIAYLGAIKEHEDRVSIINCHPKLADLMRRSFPKAKVYGDQFSERVTWRADADYQINMAGCMQHFRKEPKPAESFLRPHIEKRLQWEATLSDLGDKPRIGVAWTGGTSGSHGSATRNMSLERLLPLFKGIDAHFVCLEYKDCSAEIEAFEKKHGIKIHRWDWATETDNLDDFVALQACLDAIVCVPTTAYHIAGALCQPAFVLVHDRPHFHEAVAFDKSPWWNNVHLIRREEIGDEAAINEVLSGLQKVLK